MFFFAGKTHRLQKDITERSVYFSFILLPKFHETKSKTRRLIIMQISAHDSIILFLQLKCVSRVRTCFWRSFVMVRIKGHTLVLVRLERCKNAKG